MLCHKPTYFCLFLLFLCFQFCYLLLLVIWFSLDSLYNVLLSTEAQQLKFLKGTVYSLLGGKKNTAACISSKHGKKLMLTELARKKRNLIKRIVWRTWQKPIWNFCTCTCVLLQLSISKEPSLWLWRAQDPHKCSYLNYPAFNSPCHLRNSLMQ